MLFRSDPGSFVEYGSLAVAAQRRRRSIDDLMKNTPADGMVTGVARINGHLFDDEKARCAVLAYDYTVLAGTQGMKNHEKKDRLIDLATRLRLPVVVFTEGGGGRPGDVDWPSPAGLNIWTFHHFGRLSGLVPLVGITPTPAPLVFEKGSQKQTLAWKDDVVAWTKHVAGSARISKSELVFVGYCVVAPEYNWDDYKDVDVKGKTILMLVNDPPVPDPLDDSALDASVFGGRAMTYYGRWTYKYEIAAQKGAAGALIVHETIPAGYGFNVIQGKTGEQFDLVTPDKNMGRAAIEIGRAHV